MVVVLEAKVLKDEVVSVFALYFFVSQTSLDLGRKMTYSRLSILSKYFRRQFGRTQGPSADSGKEFWVSSSAFS